MNYRWSPVWPVLCAALILGGCAPKMVKTTEFGNPQSAPRILIATEQSEFKQAVIEKVVKDPAQDRLFFKITDLRNLENETAAAYSAVIIVSTCRAWQLNSRVSTFLQETSVQAKIVLLTTAGDEQWEAGVEGVDAFTAASSPADVEQTAEKLQTRIHAIINAAS